MGSYFVAQADDTIPPRWKEEAITYRDPHTPEGLSARYEKELVSKIRRRILETVATEEHESYTGKIPASGTTYSMIPIRGGTFLMGSPSQEAGRNGDESEHKVIVSSFWMSRTETTWPQFLPYAVRKDEAMRNRNGSPNLPDTATDLLDWISAPTQPYTSPDFGMGIDGDYPAIGMSQHAANKYCQWLSLQTGHFYRLPTEAEWEYACRAGTTGPYSFPLEQIEDFAVIDPKFTRTGYEKVGTKKPNPWGLYDMHGNVMEWCLDGYTATAYDILPAKDPWFRATQNYPRVVRGGSWYDSESQARCALRLFSSPVWNIQDPVTPRSVWWFTDAGWLGFRIVRPVAIPSEADMFEAWNTGAVHPKDSDVIPDER